MEFLYFFISYSRKEREDPEEITFVNPENDDEKPECIYSEQLYEKNSYSYRKVYKAIKKSSEKEGQFYFEFELDDIKYIISFNSPKDKLFVYDLNLSSGKIDLNIIRKINQNKIGYIQKLKYFKKALENIQAVKDVQELYEETLDLYIVKKGFYFLIELFLEIYDKKDLCSKLMLKFREMNKNTKEKEKNMDRKEYLFKEEYLQKFSDILSNASKIINDNQYEPVDFYGIIFCYLNYYNENSFEKYFNNFIRDNPKILFEILLTYRKHFINPISQDINFFDEFVDYTLTKKEDISEEDPSSKKGTISIKSKKDQTSKKTTSSKKETTSKKGDTTKKESDIQIAISYIQEIEIIIQILDKNIDKILKKYKGELKNIIIIDKKFKFNKGVENINLDCPMPEISKVESIETTIENKSDVKASKPKKKKKNEKIFSIINEIKQIIEFSEKNKVFIVYFTNDFWKYTLNHYNEPIRDNIKICSELRKIFIKYYELVKKLFDENTKDSDILKEAKNYYAIDEFAFLIDQILRKVFIKEELPNIEKLAYITQYNPYYKEAKYYKKAELDILDLFDLNDIENDKKFISDFKNMKFEQIFKKNISEYLDKIFSKIKTIPNFVNIIKLINIKDIEDFGKTAEYLQYMNKKYDSIIKDKINKLRPEELSKAIKVVADIAIINYKCELKEEEKKKNDKEKVKEKIKFKDKEKKQFEFIEKRIKKLNKNLIPQILIEIMNICIEYYNEKDKDEIKEEKEEEEKDNENKSDDNEDEKYLDKEEDINLKEMEKYIFKEFTKLNNEQDIDNIINLINCLKNVNKKRNDKESKNERLEEFLKELISKYLIKKEEYFSKKKNLKVDLLCKLNKEEMIKKNNEPYYDNINNLIQEIRTDLDGNGDIKKKKLDEFLKNSKEVIIQRLDLIKLVIDNFDSEEKYNDLIAKINKINKTIKDLSFIRDNIKLYFKDSQQDLIRKLKNAINKSDNMNIKYEGSEIDKLQKETKDLYQKAENIYKVKDFLLFDEIYKTNKGENFDKAYEKLDKIKEFFSPNEKADINNLYLKKEYKEIFDKIRKKISNNESKANKFIKNFVEYYSISNPETIDELTILFKSKKFENDINSIIFFFNYFEKDNDSWNKKLSKDYENLSECEFKDIREKLKILKKNEIYDYKNIGDYNKIFTRLYNKKEAFEYLFSKDKTNIDKLKDEIDPTDRTISIDDIKDTENCIKQIDKMKRIKDNNQIFEYIKSMNKDTINQFENYSKIYISIIELDQNYVISQLYAEKEKEKEKKKENEQDEKDEKDEKESISDNIYKEVYNIIKIQANFTIFQDKEEFEYISEKKLNKKEQPPNQKISLRKLIALKNKIHIKENKKIENNNIEDDNLKTEDGNKKENINEDNEMINIKTKRLLFFKETISNLEIIINYMKELRSRGSSLPIIITIIIKKESKNNNELEKIEYCLGGQEKDFEEIRKFLSNVKEKYVSQLEMMYKEKVNLRMLYGQQFMSLMKHLESGISIDSFLRYILNITDNNKQIHEGYRAMGRKVQDYIKYYEKYNEESLENISSYITTVFKNNEITPEKYYDDIKIIPINGYKGIYSYECKKNEMEKNIIYLFWNNIFGLPVAQNVLITNNETSPEEIQAFFNRAILCKYNTLFVVEINDTFSIHQQSLMNNYLNDLLSYKNKQYNERYKQNIDKKKTRKYLDSCIIFLYEKDNNHIPPNLKEFDKFNNSDDFTQNKDATNEKGFLSLSRNGSLVLIPKNAEKKEHNYDNLLAMFENIKVISSDICGLGKSEKIKYYIDKDDKKYFHFPLGGIVTKSIIFEKLNNLMKKIKNEDYKKIAIHLDLTESKERSIINEFFFSLLITKFYKNNENIIYIPKDIDIYIEIPNCFQDYLSKFSILTVFEKKRENITFENMQKFNYPKEMIDIFNRMLNIDSNEKMQEWVKNHIGIEKYSYHQINIFIKLFISQYNKFKSKLRFLGENKEDVTEQCIKEFSKCTRYFTNGGFSRLMTGLDKYDDSNELDILSKVYDNDLRNMKFTIPLIFIIKELRLYHKLTIPEKNSTEYKNNKEYLERIDEILNLNYNIEDLLKIIEEKNNTYVITNDNFKKMVLLVYRIKANVPVIIMGDTGCGKTALITKLNQILNNGKKTVEIINIHPGITDENLCELMKEKDKIAKDSKIEELWVFFDEINTCLSLSLLTEIFINRTYNGNKISDKIRLIGACNPYRKRKGNKEKCGISLKEDDDEELVYLVQPLPQSLLYYVFSFGSIDPEDEQKYIYSIIEKLFGPGEENLHKKTSDIISQCHIYLRDTFDPSVVSLREIARFLKCVKFFIEYYKKKYEFEGEENINEKNNKLRSIICSIYLCYYIRLTDDKKRNNFENMLRSHFLDLVNNGIALEEKTGNLISDIKNESFRAEIKNRPKEQIKNFSDFLKIEENFLIKQIELDKGIGENSLLKENLFLLFVSVITNIPLIIIGKPGSGKSLSAKLITKSLKGKFSNNKFFQLFPQIIQTYFQGSRSTEPKDVSELFEKAEKKLSYYKHEKKKLPISMILFDELGLADEHNALKVLHSKLEYDGKEEGVSFVGISNYSLDAAKVNRALILSVPDLDEKLDEIVETSQAIVASISASDKLKDDKIFELISNTYFEYKNQLKIIKELVVYKKLIIYEYENNKKNGSDNNSFKSIDKNLKKNEKRSFEFIKELKDYKYLYKLENEIKIDFHGNRDFYYIIKGIANELDKLGETDDKVKIVIEFIERNFGGIEYKVDLDLDVNLEDMKKKIEMLKEIYSDLLLEQNKIIKLNSVFLFKALYNKQCDKLDPNGSLKIPKDNINSYNLNRCINSNIRDITSRYLLLGIKPSLTTLLTENIIMQNDYLDIKLYEGSPFIGDNKSDYRFRKINEIQDDAKEEKLIIIENLNQIHPFLFDLYNMNYTVKDEKKFARICFDNFNEQLTEVCDNFRIIILENRYYINKCDLALLSRLETMVISFDKLLDNDIKKMANDIIDHFKIQSSIKSYKDDINYSLEDLLINCGTEEIQGLVYYYTKVLKANDEQENNEKQIKNLDNTQIEENIANKIYKILPQDIIFILPDENNIIKKKYYDNKNIYNFKDYLDFLKQEDNKQYKISIIYTFTNITDTVAELNDKMRFNISNIRSETGFKNQIDEIKNANENNIFKKENYICIDFDQTNSKNVKFISNYILNNFKDDKFYYNYLLIIHINRNFNKENHQRIYSLPDIKGNINQIFIDNLNGNNNLNVGDLLSIDIKKFLEEQKEELKLEIEFDNTLRNFLYKELIEADINNNKIDDYINNIIKYMNEETAIKNKINEIVFKFFDENKDNEKVNCKDIIEEIYTKQYINKYTLDIMSLLIDYIKEIIYNKYLKIVFTKLEDDNILTILYENQKKGFKDLNKNDFETILNKYLDNIKKDEKKLNCKFLFNYNIPGFYNFYISISDYINKNIILNYFNNEKNLRKTFKEDFNALPKFKETEKFLLNTASKEIDNSHKFIFDTINIIPLELLLKDYITFYLNKYKDKNGFHDDIDYKDYSYHRLIELLLNLRFNEENKIIIDGNNLDLFLIKIIWMESNINYIFSILKIFECTKIIYSNETNKLYNKIEEQSRKIIYITKESRNPEHTRKINECFYKLLASICYCLTSEEIKLVENRDINKKNELQIEISHFYYKLIEINKNLIFLNDELSIYLNEMYIVDELIKIIEIFKHSNIKKITDIKKIMVENVQTLQKYDGNYDSDEFFENIRDYINQLYELIKGVDYTKNQDYYDKLRYILFKEFKKINDINYRHIIIKKLLDTNEMIKKSTDFLQMVFKKYLEEKLDKFKNNISNVLNSQNDIILNYIESKLDNIFLEETIFYFFEKYSIVFIKNLLKKDNKVYIDEQLLVILEECIKYLDEYKSGTENNDNKLKELCKLFCLSYIKGYCYIFINLFNDDIKNKCKEPKTVINIIKKENPIYKMMRLFIYKILFNKFDIDAFINNDIITKYKLKDYGDLDTNGIIQIKELYNIYKIDFPIKTLKPDNSGKIKKILEKSGEDLNVNIRDFKISENGIDNFYIDSYNYTLSNLFFKNQDINPKFYNQICEPLFRNEAKLLNAIKLFYEIKKFNSIKNDLKINSNNIKPLIFGYRFCLNELFFKKMDGIYYPLYTQDYNKYMKEKFYPGNNSKINCVYSDIIKHFENKYNEGCYVCFCRDWYYHSIPSGFPGENDIGMKCPKCSENIGSIIKNGNVEIVNRKNYVRIFKDQEEIEEIQNSDKRKKLKQIHYMTLEEFEEKYINKYKEEEKGIYNIDKENIKKDKRIRNLEPITFRLLNYILNIHLFFSRLLLTDKKESDFDKNYLPRGMSWVAKINECWNLLNNELLNENIDSIEDFMYYIFVDLFNKLNQHKYIENYDELITIENEIDGEIQKKIQDYKNGNSISEKTDGVNSFINLLKEKYSSNSYEQKDFPFYKYFYYVYYLDENYIMKKLELVEKNKYPVLNQYLENKIKTNDKSKENKFDLKYLNIFNKALNLINQTYLNNISRELAEKTKLVDEKIYKKNRSLFDKFIDFYNSLKLKDIKGVDMILNKNNSLNDFFIERNNKYGRNYIEIYKEFAKQQNKEIIKLLKLKYLNYENYLKNEINIQQINEDGIYTLELPEEVSFASILFDSSYRKILDSETLNYRLYKEYEINYDLIEEKMTSYLLNNKNRLNDNISEFIFNKEIFNNKISDFITEIQKKYNININIDDKVAIYKFYNENKNNIPIYINIIQDFKSLLKALNDNNNIDITEETKISEAIDKLKNNLEKPDLLRKMFEGNDNLKIGKIYSIFHFYLKVIYHDISETIKNYQIELDDKSKKLLKDYYIKNTKNLINQKSFASALRLFISLILLPEEDKDNKIQKNNNNVINYLNAPDLWPKDIFINQNFEKNLNELRFIDAKICQIAYLYDALEKDINEEEFKEVINIIENEKKADNSNDEGADVYEDNEEHQEEEDDDDDDEKIDD